MSDDIPLLFANDSPAPAVVFLCASNFPQMQQYATAGWRVIAAQGFTASRSFDLADVPAERLDDTAIDQPVAVSCEGPHWSAQHLERIARWRPMVVKVNCAFYDIDAAQVQAVMNDLSARGLTVLGAHWKENKTFRIPSLNRIDVMSALEPPEWSRLNFLACADERMAQMILKVGRLHSGQEQAIAQLRLSEAVRDDYIARLEAALVASQQSPNFKLQKP